MKNIFTTLLLVLVPAAAWALALRLWNEKTRQASSVDGQENKQALTTKNEG